MRSYKITGMSCSACVARVEKAVKKLENIDSCSVNLLTKTMVVSGKATDSEIINTVKAAGYGASLANEDIKNSNDEFKDTETPYLLKRLVLSIGFLLVLMYFSMGYTMWSFPLPAFFDNNPIAVAIIQCVLALCVMVVNRRFFISGVKGVLSGGANMDTLVSMGSFVSFAYSFVIMLSMIGENTKVQHHYLHSLYFESAAMILALITLGKMLEAYSKGKTTNALKSLMDLSPKTATVIIDGKETIINVSEIKRGDIFVVRPGEQFSTDGVIIEGEALVNESALTGESMPVSKVQGSLVYCATINTNGFVKCKATKESSETVLSEIIKTVKEASSTKAPAQKIADRVSGIFVPIVVLIAIITTICWLIFSDNSLGYALARGISVLVISCPCALGLATPVAIMVGSGIGAKNGVLFKNATSLEESGKLEIIALDKTGTITKGEPQVTDVIPLEGDKDLLASVACSVEAPSEHPLSSAIVKYGEENNISPRPVSDFETVSGRGVKCKIDGKEAYAGNEAFVSCVCQISDKAKETLNQLASQGKTPMLFAYDGKLLGIIAAADTIKEDSVMAIGELKKCGLRVAMITGDNEKTARTIASQVGIDEVIAEVAPGEKGKIVKGLSESGKVAMVGDGINDAVALTEADIGIAIGNGSDIAIDSANVVLVNGSLMGVPILIRLSRRVLRTIHQNLFWAFIYNVIGIPLAAGAFVHLFGWELNPMFGALAMSLSSFFVVSNALRLNFFKSNQNIKEKKESTVSTLVIEGMMCEHCENAVKSALSPVCQVIEVSHKKGIAKIKNSQVGVDEVRFLIEKEGYKVVEIK